MSVIVTIKLVVSPARVDELVELLDQKAHESRAYPGCKAVDIYGDESDPGSLLIYQEWVSRGHHEWYFSSRAETEFLSAIEPWLLHRPEVRSLDELGA